MQDTLGSEVANRELLQAQILNALDRMPERLREVFVMQHYNGMNQQAIAQKTGIQAKELVSLVWKANSAFQRALKGDSAKRVNSKDS